MNSTYRAGTSSQDAPINSCYRKLHAKRSSSISSRRYKPDAKREYDPQDLVAFALSWPGSDYWPAVALGWLEQGVPYSALRYQLSAFEGDRHRSQALRDRARRLLALRICGGGERDTPVGVRSVR